MHELGRTESTLESIGYKQTSMIANFASTLVLPGRVASTTMLLHGARNVLSWPSPASSNDNSVTLVVSDWAESNDLTSFLIPAVNLTTGGSNVSFPFSSVHVVTQDAATAASAASSTNAYMYYGEVDAWWSRVGFLHVSGRHHMVCGCLDTLWSSRVN
jgi:hypothetical protein